MDISLSPKAIIAAVAGLGTVLAGGYQGVSLVSSLIATKTDIVEANQQRQVSDLNMLIKLDQLTIAVLSKHKEGQTDDEREKLEGLKKTVLLNECEFQKAIGQLNPDHACSS